MRALNNTELASFCGQLALILRSGISSLEGLSLMLEDTPEGEGRQILEKTLRGMEETGSLSRALQDAEVFPPYLCSMAEIGEQSGKLDDVMTSLTAHYRREEALSKNIRSAVAYPLLMLGMMIVVMTVLLVKVMPVFRQVFEQLDARLSGFSRAVLNAGDLLGRCSVVFLVLAAVLALVCIYLFFTENGQKKAQDFFCRFLFTRKLAERIAASRFANGMYLSLSSGLNVDQSLEMTIRLVEHPGMRRKIEQIRQRAAEGTNFAEAVAQAGVFTGTQTRMLAVGCRAGSLDDVMKQISEQYEDEIEEQIDTALGRLEPALVAVLSVAVGMILLSVMLPLLGVMVNIGG